MRHPFAALMYSFSRIVTSTASVTVTYFIDVASEADTARIYFQQD